MIAGVDPGTTVGWVVLDWDGNVVAHGSQRGFDRDMVVAELVKAGRIFLIGTDKAKVPNLVREVAASLGAEVVAPQEDLRVEEKREMARGLDLANMHELDAFAAARVAWRRKFPVVRKVRSFLLNESKQQLFVPMIELVLQEGLSLRAALTILTPREEAFVEEDTSETRDEDVVKLYHNLSRQRKANASLQKRNDELAANILTLEAQIVILRERLSGMVLPKSKDHVDQVKQSQIASLSQRLQNAQDAEHLIRMKLDVVESALRDDVVVLDRFASLGKKELRNVTGVGSVVFVDDAHKCSDRVVDELRKQGVELLVCKHKPLQDLPFAVIKVEKVVEGERIALVDRSWLEKVRSQASVLSKVIEEYQKERAKLG